MSQTTKETLRTFHCPVPLEAGTRGHVVVVMPSHPITNPQFLPDIHPQSGNGYTEPGNNGDYTCPWHGTPCTERVRPD